MKLADYSNEELTSAGFMVKALLKLTDIDRNVLQKRLDVSGVYFSQLIKCARVPTAKTLRKLRDFTHENNLVAPDDDLLKRETLPKDFGNLSRELSFKEACHLYRLNLENMMFLESQKGTFKR